MVNFKDNHSIIISPANLLTPEVVSSLFSEFAEILAYHFEEEENGNKICWVYYATTVAPAKAVEYRNGFEVYGSKLLVMKAKEYLKTKNLKPEELPTQNQRSSSDSNDEADASDSDDIEDIRPLPKIALNLPPVIKPIIPTARNTQKPTEIETSKEETKSTDIDSKSESKAESGNDSSSDSSHRRSHRHRHHHHHRHHRH